MDQDKQPEITESTATLFVLVKDKSGKEFVCPINALKDASELSEEERKKCIENVEGAIEG